MSKGPHISEVIEKTRQLQVSSKATNKFATVRDAIEDARKDAGTWGYITKPCPLCQADMIVGAQDENTPASRCIAYCTDGCFIAWE